MKIQKCILCYHNNGCRFYNYLEPVNFRCNLDERPCYSGLICSKCTTCKYYDKENNICDTKDLESQNIDSITDWPNFNNLHDAEKHFKETYGDKFQLIQIHNIQDRFSILPENKIDYEYRLITNMKNFKKGIENLEKGLATDIDFRLSYKIIYININGTVYMTP